MDVATSKLLSQIPAEEYRKIQAKAKELLTPERIYTPYLNLDSSLTKTVTEDDGTSANFAHIVPRYNNLNFIPKSWTWTIISLHSNFKNSVHHQSYAKVEWEGTSDPFVTYRTPVLKVSQVQHGETVFVELLLECMSTEDKYVFNTCTQTVYRGNPVNTSFRIFYPKNGKLCTEIIYDQPIESQLLRANKSRPLSARFGDTVQANRQTIDEYLSEYDTQVTNVSELELINRDNTNKKVGGKDKRLKREVVSFVKEENAFYAHGRGIDIKSVSTLLHQHPNNYFHRNVELKPDLKLVAKAMSNRWAQRPGYNSFIMPMFNPNLPLKSTKMWFPGRSGHSATSNSGANCGNSTTNDGSCGPSYEGLSNSTCNQSQTPTSQGFCCDKDCC